MKPLSEQLVAHERDLIYSGIKPEIRATWIAEAERLEQVERDALELAEGLRRFINRGEGE